MSKCQRKRLPIVVFCFSAAYFLLSNISYAEEGQQVSDQLKLLIEMDKKVYEFQEPIPIRFKIRNDTKATLFLHPILDMDLEFYLRHESESQTTNLNLRVSTFQVILKENIVRLEPGAVFSFKRSIMKELYSMPNRSGRYQVYATYVNRTKSLQNFEPLWTGELRSNILEFGIK